MGHRRSRATVAAQMALVVAVTAAVGFLATPPAAPQAAATSTAPSSVAEPVVVAPGRVPPASGFRITNSGALVPLPGRRDVVIVGGPLSTPYSSRPMHTAWIEINGRLRLVAL